MIRVRRITLILLGIGTALGSYTLGVRNTQPDNWQHSADKGVCVTVHNDLFCER